MELNELKFFIRVSELNSISKVAAENNMAVSAVSSHINNLERSLGVLLFDRKGKSVRLNEKGEILYQHAIRLINLQEDACREIKDHAKIQDYELCVSTLTIPKILPYLITGFKEKYPDIKLKVSQYQKTKDISDMNSDIMLYSAYKQHGMPNERTIYEEPIVLLVSKEHPLAGVSSIDINDIQGEKFICPSKISDFGQQLYKRMDQWNLLPDIVAVSDYPSYVLELVAANVGIAFQPSLTHRYYNNSNIISIPVNGIRFVRYINLAWNTSRYQSLASKNFLDYAEEFMRTIG